MTALALLRHQGPSAPRLDAVKAALAGGYEATAEALVGSMSPHDIAAELSAAK